MRPWKSVSTAWRSLPPHALKFSSGIGDVKVVLEVGVDWGYSLFSFAEMFPKAMVIGVDFFAHHDGPAARAHVEDWIKTQFVNCSLWEMESASACDAYRSRITEPIDVLHIDADHKYESVSRDFELWSPLVRSGGVVLFHDIQSHPASIGRFFNELPGRKDHTMECCGLGAWYVP